MRTAADVHKLHDRIYGWAANADSLTLDLTRVVLDWVLDPLVSELGVDTAIEECLVAEREELSPRGVVDAILGVEDGFTEKDIYAYNKEELAKIIQAANKLAQLCRAEKKKRQSDD